MPESNHIESASTRLGRDFYTRDVLHVAPELLGKVLSVRQQDGRILSYAITETEAYRGENDLACHASRGRTPRNSVMYLNGGHIYMYLIYGMYWMLNIVTSVEDDPQAVLIRGIAGSDGPGKVTRKLCLDKSFYGEDAVASDRIWVEESNLEVNIKTGTRINIDYAGKEWTEKHWRFFTDDILTF